MATFRHLIGDGKQGGRLFLAPGKVKVSLAELPAASVAVSLMDTRHHQVVVVCRVAEGGTPPAGPLAILQSGG